MEEYAKTKQGETLARWQRTMKDHAFDSLRRLVILETRPEQFMRVLEPGRAATNVLLRRLYHFALNMSWLAYLVVPRLQWPKVQFKEKRAICFAEHADIVERETNARPSDSRSQGCPFQVSLLDARFSAPPCWPGTGRKNLRSLQLLL